MDWVHTEEALAELHTTNSPRLQASPATAKCGLAGHSARDS